MPDLNTYPNTHYWYLFLSSFSQTTLKAWADKYAPAPAAPAAPTPAAKPAAKDDEFDLFGDDEPAAPKVEKPKPKKEAKKKEKPIAKSIVVFDVKVYEVMTD